jgi:site-specific DNA-cytosine methylase
MLDIGCGMGGMSEGFAKEGYEVTGIDIVDAPKLLGYKYNFVQGVIQALDPSPFIGKFDVVHISMPCRDFSPIGRCYGKKWKNPPDIEHGLQLIRDALAFKDKVVPKFWIMENVYDLSKHYVKPRMAVYLRHKKHGFWGNFPLFLFHEIKGKPLMVRKGDFFVPRKEHHKRLQPWIHAKLPLECSQAFARACKETLLTQIQVSSVCVPSGEGI